MWGAGALRQGVVFLSTCSLGRRRGGTRLQIEIFCDVPHVIAGALAIDNVPDNIALAAGQFLDDIPVLKATPSRNDSCMSESSKMMVT